jgi:cellulose synthase/poly-beta-1,6-N-acetylglucosamine synthase-like glycosyltransferase
MLILDVISVILLSILLFWTVYNGSIIYIGVRSRRKNVGIVRVKNKEFPKFSIIVPTKDEEIVISRCLTGILELDYPKDKMEIIVVDGNSSDSTRKICSEFRDKHPAMMKIVNEKESRGKPAALNIALTYVTGEIVGVFDADSLPEKDVLSKVASYFDDKQVTAIQGRTTSLNEKKNILTRVISAEEKAWFQALLSGREHMQLFVPLNGSCQFVRLGVLKELDGWDENSLTEDVELALRLVEKKHLIKYAHDVCSGQETPNGLRELVKQRVRWYRGYMETALKYGRLLDSLNKRTIDAEISMAGPFMMVISLLSYINWFFVMLFFSSSNPIVGFTGIVIALTAVSLVSIGVGLTASEKPIKIRNLAWIPSIWAYWMLQMFIAGYAFLKLIFRRKRVWSKTLKKGFITTNLKANKPL